MGTLTSERVRQLVQTSIEASLLSPRCNRDAVLDCYAALLETFGAPVGWLLELYPCATVAMRAGSSVAVIEHCLVQERHSVALWGHYLSIVSHDVEQAERVAMRAVRAVPWSKELWMSLLQIVPEEDRIGLLDLMEEKALRMICTLE